jgi:DNA-binding FadR family transcriptional regulator
MPLYCELHDLSLKDLMPVTPFAGPSEEIVVITPRPVGGSVLRRTADALRKLALSHRAGEFLGSEEQLMRELGASRPTLRQASAQVVQDNLIEIRRGIGGGYFASVPESGGVSRLAAIYLRAHDVSMEEIVQAIEPTRVEIAKLAARSDNQAARAWLKAFLARDDATPVEGDYRNFLRDEREFGRILGEMSGSPVFMLFLQILYDFTALLRRGEGVFANRLDRVAAYQALRGRMAQAILEGDEEIAVVATHRCAALVNGWLREDHARQPRMDDGPVDIANFDARGAATL